MISAQTSPMKAIVVEKFGEPDVLKLAEFAVPEVGPGQILVHLSTVGVNPVETYIRTGTHTVKPDLPYIPGTDGAGTIEVVAEDIDEFKVGDRVYLSGAITGTYGEFALCTRADVHFLPANLSFSQGAGLGVPYGAAYRGLIQRGQAKAGETVLIHGASGSVGIATIQIARLYGLRILGTAGTKEGLSRIAQQGSEAFNHHSDGYLEEIRNATGGGGPDLILEMLANVNLERDLELLAPSGRIVIVGTRGEANIKPRLAITKEADIRGMSLPHASDWEQASIYAGIAAGLEVGVLVPIVGKELPVAQAAEAHRLVMESGSKGKIVLIP